ncbi:MAG: hypothetical protein J5507_02390 [Clostridia bacterium]|nr:hypothetical protein [Clostridia bacterium]
MKDKELRIIYKEYFQEKMKQSPTYKAMFSKAVDEEKEYFKTIPKEDRVKLEKIIYSFIEAEDQMLEDTFVNAVKYAYKVFKEIENKKDNKKNI